jgi:hypothetical protein
MSSDADLYSDAARRASDQITMHLLADPELAIHSWVAIRLSDGGSDGVLYADKASAIRRQLHEQQCMYLKIPPDGMSPKIAERLLTIHRQIYDAGMRLADPDGGDRELIIPMNIEDVLR